MSSVRQQVQEAVAAGYQQVQAVPLAEIHRTLEELGIEEVRQALGQAAVALAAVYSRAEQAFIQVADASTEASKGTVVLREAARGTADENGIIMRRDGRRMTNNIRYTQFSIMPMLGQLERIESFLSHVAGECIEGYETARQDAVKKSGRAVQAQSSLLGNAETFANHLK